MGQLIDSHSYKIFVRGMFQILPVLVLTAYAHGLPLKNVPENNSFELEEYLELHYKEPWANVDEIDEGDLGVGVSARIGLTEVSKWPHGTIPFVLRNLHEKNIRLIMKAMDIYHEKTCIRFRPRRPTDKDYIVIDGNSTSCSSLVGNDHGQQIVYLSNKQCFNKIGTAFHELMHVVGFDHEHSRPDRDKYITINMANVKPNSVDNFEIVNINNLGIEYDFESVMHYSLFAFAQNKAVPTIIPKHRLNKNIVVGQRNGPSKLDLLKINVLYDCASFK